MQNVPKLSSLNFQVESKERLTKKIVVKDYCPECSSRLIFIEASFFCPRCGFSEYDGKIYFKK